jgi:hypothetical protein
MLDLVERGTAVGREGQGPPADTEASAAPAWSVLPVTDAAESLSTLG